MPLDVCNNAIMPLDVCNNAIMPLDVCNNAIMPLDVCNNAIMPRDVYNNATMPRDVCNNATMPRDVCNNAIIPRDVCNNAITPRDVCNNAIIPRDVCNNAIIPRDVCNNSIIPRDVCNNAIIPRDVCNNANLPFDELLDHEPSDARQPEDPFAGKSHFISGEDTWDNLGLRIVFSSPDVPGSKTVHHLDPVVLQLCVEFKKPLRLKKINVYAWTNLFHADNPEGGFARVPLPYVDDSREWDDDGATRYTYRRTVLPADIGEYSLMFYVQRGRNCVWISRSEDSLTVKVEPNLELNVWNRTSNITQMTKYISVGNGMAVAEADEMKFRYVITLDKTIREKTASGTEFLSFPVQEGASNPIPAPVISKVLLRLHEYTIMGDPVLIASRLGQGRAGSLIVAYIYANNPCLSFNEACAYVSERRQIYTHAGLMATLTKLYPRD